jgi:hypothetical protein
LFWGESDVSAHQYYETTLRGNAISALRRS